MAITIESATLQHLHQLYEIEKESFEKEAFSKQQIAHLLTNRNSIGLIAKENDQIVGFVIGMIYVERNSLTGHILTIDVSPTCRRKGIGSKLLREIEEIFKKNKVQACRLEVRENNVAALNLYQKFGYKKIGRLKNFYGDADGIYLRKTLA